MPTLLPEAEDYWEAWNDLCASRGAGFSANPIAAADVAAWCDMHQVAAWRRPLFWRVLRAVDAEWLKELSKHDDPPARH